MGFTTERIDPKDIIDAIHSKKGVIMEAADAIPCHRSTIYNMMKTHPAIKKAVEEAREQAVQDELDLNIKLRQKAYKSADQLLGEFDTTMTIFTLKYLCDWEAKQKSNLYIENIEKPYREENSNTVPIPVQKISDSSLGST